MQTRSADKNQGPVSKITAKRAGGMVQVVEFMPSKCNALDSNPNTIKNKQTNKYIRPEPCPPSWS
jgi:hypothetical protein